MIKVIVAEDKHPILRNLVKKIEGYRSQLHVIGEASDGLTALEMCLRLKPHIVFTDIRMPGMDGLELIKQLKQACPETIFVIISGYNDFEYARQAIQLGVKEYVLKPVTQQAMDEVLERVTHLALSQYGAKEQQYISDLLKGRHISPDRSTLEAENKSYRVLIICVGSISKFQIDLANPYHDVWFKFDMPRFLANHHDIAYDNAWVFDGEAMNEIVVVFRCETESPFPTESLYDAFCQAFSRQQEHFFTFAMSNRVEKLCNLKLEYQLTRMILSHNAVFGMSKLIQVGDYALNAPNLIDPDKSFNKQKLLSFMKKNNKEAFLSEIKLCLADWERSKLSQVNIELCLTHMLQCMCQAMLQQNIVSRDLKLELDEVISISKDYPSLFRNISFLFEKFFHHAQGNSDSASNSVKNAIEIVDQYLQDHMADELTIADIADMVNFNVSFLSREFKKIKGVSPIEYLTQLRIEKAKRLILEPSNHKFKDIGDMVGYSNPYYFSKVFKLVTGLTPSEYKNAYVTTDR